MDLSHNLTGVKKAALFLLVMGEDFTSEVFKHLEDDEVKLIGEEMAQVNNIDYKMVSGIMDEFSQRTGGGNILGISGKDFLQRTFPKAFGSKKADDLLGDLFARTGARSFEKLNALNPQILGNLLASEHPQTIALILSNLKHQTAADIITQLPEDTQSEVVMRISDLEEVPNDIIGEVQEVIEELLADIDKETGENLGGIQTVAEILNHLDHKTENAIFEKIEMVREELADEIRQKMFLFEDLVELDDRSIRALLKEVGNDELMLALKTATEDLKDKVFSNVSQRAAAMMKEDMEVMGPVKLRDVEQAQLNIIKTARRLEEEGKLVLGSRGGEEVLV